MGICPENERGPKSGTCSEACTCDEQDRVFWGDITFQLSRALASANSYLAQLMANGGLTGMVPSHGSILVLLRESDRPLSMSELASAVGKDPSTVTALVKKLEKLGYVRTERCACDRRHTQVSLMPGSEGIMQKIEAIGERLSDVLRKEFPEEELCTLRAQLVTIQGLYASAARSAGSKSSASARSAGSSEEEARSEEFV